MKHEYNDRQDYMVLILLALAIGLALALFSELAMPVGVIRGLGQ